MAFSGYRIMTENDGQWPFTDKAVKEWDCDQSVTVVINQKYTCELVTKIYEIYYFFMLSDILKSYYHYTINFI